MDNKFCSPQTYQHFNDLNYCPNPQCNNIKKGKICLNSNTDTNIITKYDWAVKSLCEECNCAWYLCKLCSNLKSPLKSKTSVYNHHYRYHQSNNNSVNSMFNNDLKTNNKSPNQPKCSKRKKTQHESSAITSNMHTSESSSFKNSSSTNMKPNYINSHQSPDELSSITNTIVRTVCNSKKK